MQRPGWGWLSSYLPAAERELLLLANGGEERRPATDAASLRFWHRGYFIRLFMDAQASRKTP